MPMEPVLRFYVRLVEEKHGLEFRPMTESDPEIERGNLGEGGLMLTSPSVIGIINLFEKIEAGEVVGLVPQFHTRLRYDDRTIQIIHQAFQAAYERIRKNNFPPPLLTPVEDAGRPS